MPDEKTYMLLGLAFRARRLCTGSDACEIAVKKRKACLVIVAEDASDNTKKKYKNMCNYRNIEIIFWGEKDLLGKFTGKGLTTVAALTDEGFAKRFKEMLV